MEVSFVEGKILENLAKGKKGSCGVIKGKNPKNPQSPRLVLSSPERSFHRDAGTRPHGAKSNGTQYSGTQYSVYSMVEHSIVFTVSVFYCFLVFSQLPNKKRVVAITSVLLSTGF